MEQEALNRLAEATANAYQLPSVSVSVYANGTEHHSACGYADLEADVAATPNSLYSIGSSTKAFIATATCILASQGRLDLDRPVRDALPWFKMYDPYLGEHLTPRDALCHRSGMPRHDLTWLNTPDRTMRQLVEALAYLPPAFPLRYRMHYQNHMFMLVTLLVEEASGQPWGDFVRERILSPLGMGSTYITGDLIDDGDSRKARPYRSAGDRPVRMPYNYAKSVGGAGTIYSSTRDMLKWLRFHLAGNEAILPVRWLNEMHMPQMLIKPGEMPFISFPEMDLSSYGLGWFNERYRGVRMVHHGGTIDGFKSLQVLLPDHDIAVSVLANLNGTQAVSSLAYKVVDSVLGLESVDWDARFLEASAAMMNAIKDDVSAKVRQAQEKAAACAEPARYAGAFSHPAYGTAVVQEENSALVLRFAGLTLPMTPLGEDAFLVAAEEMGLALKMQFVCGAKNAAALDMPLEPALPDTPLRFFRV